MRSVRPAASLFVTLAFAATACSGPSSIANSPPSLTASGAAAPSVAAVPSSGTAVVAKPTPRLTPPATSKDAAPDFVACMLTGPNPIDDKGINAASLAGMEAVKQARGIQTHALAGTDGPEFVANVNTFASQTCDLIVAVGFQLDDTIAGAAAEYPNQRFSTVDFGYDTSDTAFVARVAADMHVSNEQAKAGLDQVRALRFEPGQAAMLAGYLAAGSSKTGRVGTFGGESIPSVTAFMDGFVAGVHYYNEQKGKTVQVLGWDAVGHTGMFTNDFSDESKGAAAAVELLAKGADVIVPVTGSATIGAAKAVHESTGRRNLLIGSEFDQFVVTPQYGDVILTSILKRPDNAVQTVIGEAVDGTFEGGVYLGTLANGGVSLAPYHDLAGAVPKTLTNEIDGLRAAIADGSVTVAAFVAPAR